MSSPGWTEMKDVEDYCGYLNKKSRCQHEMTRIATTAKGEVRIV